MSTITKRFLVTETVTIQKEVEMEVDVGKDFTDMDSVRSKAYINLPDYDAAGWDLIGSEGPIIKEVV